MSGSQKDYAGSLVAALHSQLDLFDRRALYLSYMKYS
jgi:hypothetical protein